MTFVRLNVSMVSTVAACLFLLAMVVPPPGSAEGPPPCQPPAGYVPPEVDLRIVGLMSDQRVAVGSTHDLSVEARDADGVPWGERFDWYVSGEHVATGPEFAWTVTGPRGDQRVTLVASSGDVSAWVHTDVAVGSASAEPPSWLGPVMRVVPLAAVAFWLVLVHRQMSNRRGGD